MTFAGVGLRTDIHRTQTIYLQRYSGLPGWNEASLRLLKHLFQHSYPENHHEDRTAAHLSETFHWPVEQVPTYVGRLERYLSDCYKLKPQRFQVRISRGGKGPAKSGENYRVQLIDTLGNDSLHRFWGHHLRPEAGPVVLATNAPLFFRHSRGAFRVRAMGVNSRADRDHHVELNRTPDLSDCDACFHYLSTGDFRLCFALTKLFLRERVDVYARIVIGDRNLVTPFTLWDEVGLRDRRSLIAIGNPRVSWVVKELQNEIEPNSI